jgi:hypothetical protein
MSAADLGSAVRRCILEQAEHGEVSQEVGLAFIQAVIAFAEVCASFVPRALCIPRPSAGCA